ncbi:MAG TPA: hypothetical protein VIZ69_01595 [Thermoanaerobaculia bacterium]
MAPPPPAPAPAPAPVASAPAAASAAPTPSALEPTSMPAGSTPPSSSSSSTAYPASAPPPAASVPAQAAAPAPPARPYQDILRLKQAGLSDDFILNKVRTEGVNYGLTTSEIVELRSAGLSEGVLGEMLRSGQPAAATAGAAVARKAEFSGLSRVGRGFMGIGTTTKNVGRLVVDGDTITFTGAQDADKNFSVFAKNVKEFFNTCVLRPNQNLCLEVGFVTYTGDEYRFRDPGWKNGDNRLVTEVSNYFRQAFPNLFFSQRSVNEL